jgi:glycerol-3-phosphate acyltransferase PlsY
MVSAIDWSSSGQALIALLFGYLCGSIPFGVVLTRLAGTPDIRTVGSGNIGATNVLRTGRKALAAATLLGDMLKGTVAVLAVMYLANHNLAMAAGLGAFLGHLFPVWLHFKGGKGVATYLGVLLALSWPAAVVFCLVWLAVAAVSRYSSLAALISGAATPATLLATSSGLEPVLFGVLTVILWVRHHDNIARLLAGTEGKIGQKQTQPLH